MNDELKDEIVDQFNHWFTIRKLLLGSKFDAYEAGYKAAIENGLPTRAESFLAFKESWLDYPSQDNEGYQPDRGGFKCGWMECYRFIENKFKNKGKKK